MKNVKILLAFIVFSFLMSACEKESGENNSKVQSNGLTKEINAIIKQATIDELEDMGVPIYKGENPPLLVNVLKASASYISFRVSPFSLIASTVPDDKVGDIFADYTGKFYNQDTNKLTITMDYSSGRETGAGIGAFITGSGSDFSVFAKTNTKINSCNAEVIWIISGTLSNNIITDIIITNIMVNDNGDACNVFMPNDKFRVFAKPLIILPTVTTASISNITSGSAICGGNVTDDNGTEVTARGVCWSTSENPTISNNKTTDGSGKGQFTSNLTGLTANTKYYVRAYATNGNGTEYGSSVSFTTSEVSKQPVYGTMTDHEGNSYKTVKIGTQTWMAENLRIKTYTDGKAIPSDLAAYRSIESGFMCIYKNTTDEQFIKTYGRLYNYYAIKTGKMCPAGWHVPTKEDYEKLLDYLYKNGYNSISTDALTISKSLAYTTLWKEFEREGTIGKNPLTNNSTGFSAVPSGFAVGVLEVDHLHLGETAYYWSSTPNNSITTYTIGILYDSEWVKLYAATSNQSANAIRLIKD